MQQTWIYHKNMLSKRRLLQKRVQCILYESCMERVKLNYSDNKQTSGCLGVGCREGVRMTAMGHEGILRGDGKVSYLN